MSKTSPNPNAGGAAAPIDRELGPLPSLPEQNGRATCAANLDKFISRYFGNRPPGGPVMQRFQTAIFNQNPEQPDVPPNSPAARLIDVAILWALLTGRRRAVLLAGDRSAAIACIRSMAQTLATNELLAAEWPEACLPIRHARTLTAGERQTFHGAATDVEIAAERIRLADLRGGHPVGVLSHAPGAFVCTTFYQPSYDLRVLTLPPAADAA